MSKPWEVLQYNNYLDNVYMTTAHVMLTLEKHGHTVTTEANSLYGE